MTILRNNFGCVCRLSRKSSGPVRQQLVVFPHAGGGVSFYQHWRDVLADDIDLFIVQYPGREESQRTEGWTNAKQAIDASTRDLQASLGIAPIVIFGHSMGALLALHVASALRSSRFQSNTVLSSQHRPTDLLYLEQEAECQRLLDNILAYSESSGSLVLDEFTRPAVSKLILQDLKLLGHLARLAVPDLKLRILGGDCDPLVSQSALYQWENTVPGCQIELMPGDHFYFRQDEAAFLRQLIA
ncbi:thioesterase II family protein [Rouxiella sp. Mn2063]|uniref:thioesterase II family protein n=1 Tax=Rouxiella sp. Mn2063 TaxID=3395262 RepID=UPI003BC12A92